MNWCYDLKLLHITRRNDVKNTLIRTATAICDAWYDKDEDVWVCCDDTFTITDDEIIAWLPLDSCMNISKELI